MPLTSEPVSNITFGEFHSDHEPEVPALQASSSEIPRKRPYTVSGIDVTKQGVEIYPSDFPPCVATRLDRRTAGTRHNMVLTADSRGAWNPQLGELDLNRFARTADGLSPVIPRCPTTPDFNLATSAPRAASPSGNPEGRTVYDGLLVKVQKRFSHRYQFVASYALQKNLLEAATVNLNNYMSTYGPNLAKQNLNIAGVVELPFGVRLSINSSLISATPANPVISGIDLNGSGNTSYPLSFAVGLPYACINYSCGNSQLVSGVAKFNSTLAGPKALNGATVPTLTLPSDYHTGAPIVDQDVRVTKEFSYKERYKLQVFGEFFNVLNIGNLVYANVTLNSSAFGQPTARVGQGSTFSSGGPRAIQVGARISF